MILDFFKNLFRKKTESTAVTDFSDAVEWIKTYRKTGNYDTGIMAGRELGLKIKTAITYNEAAKRKIIALEASNLESVAKSAHVKHKEVEVRLKHFYKWERIVSDLVIQTEKDKVVAREKEIEMAQKNKFSDMENQIKGFIKDREYVKALQHARALVATFEGNEKAVKLLMKIQAITEKQKTKAERQAEIEKRLKKFFEELGSELRPKNTVREKDLSAFGQLKFLIYQYRSKGLARREYVKEQKTLKTLESLLVRAGGISQVGADGEVLLDAVKTGTVRAVSNFSLPGYDFFGQIMGKDRIVGDTFGSYQTGKKTIFYFGDATGHGIQAGFTVAELSKIFHEHAKKGLSFQDLFTAVNNELKEKLKGKVFVTGVFFEHDAERNELRFIGGGHDPMFLYRSQTKETEKIIPGGLALWVRPIKNVSSVKIRTLEMGHKDVLFGYTDGFVECRDLMGKLFGITRLGEVGAEAVAATGADPEKAFKYVLDEVKRYANSFEDDVSGFFWTRNTDKDTVVNHEQLQQILDEVGLKERDARLGTYKNRNRAEIVEMLKKEEHAAELKRRLGMLDRLYKMGEFLKLRQKIQESIREGYVDNQMTRYLEKVILNEDKVKAVKLEEKLRRKYETLVELQKKGENEIVIREIVEIITRWGKI